MQKNQIEKSESAAPKMPRPSTSIYRGVSLNPTSRKFVAQYKYNKKTHYIGLFFSEARAAIAYDDAIHDLQIREGLTRHIYNFGNPNLLDSQQKRAAALALAPSNSEERARTPYNPFQLHDEPREDNLVSIRGISWYAQRQTWKLSVQINKHKYYLGHADTYEEAVQKYVQSLKELLVKFPDNAPLLIKIRRIEIALSTNTLLMKKPGEGTQQNRVRKKSKLQVNEEEVSAEELETEEEEEEIQEEEEDQEVDDQIAAFFAYQDPYASDLELPPLQSFLPLPTSLQPLPAPILQQAAAPLPITPLPPPPLASTTPEPELDLPDDILHNDSLFFLWDNEQNNSPRFQAPSPLPKSVDELNEELTELDRVLQYRID